jgi:replicative DNA helicase
MMRKFVNVVCKVSINYGNQWVQIEVVMSNLLNNLSSLAAAAATATKGDSPDILAAAAEVESLDVKEDDDSRSENDVLDEIEGVVIASLIKQPLIYKQAKQEELDASDFVSNFYRLVWTAFESLTAKKQVIDVFSLSLEIDQKHHVNARERLAKLLADVYVTYTTTTIQPFIQKIKEASKIRAIERLSAEMLGDIKQNGSDVVSSYAMRLTRVGGTREAKTLSASQVVARSLDLIDSLINLKPGSLMGVPVGIPEIDNAGGYYPTDFIVVGARPAMGKTTFLGNCTLESAYRGYGSLVFSGEMPAEQLACRYYANMALINNTKFRAGGFTDEEQTRLFARMAEFGDLPIHIDADKNLFIERIEHQSRVMVEEHGVKSIWIDYLQRIESKKKFGTIRELIMDNTIRLKALAMELKVPVIALAQVSREVDRRPDKRPMNSDIRECANIEQEADLIQMLYRDDVYNDQSPDRNILEIINTKARHGVTGTIKTIFEGQHSRIKPLDAYRSGFA